MQIKHLFISQCLAAAQVYGQQEAFRFALSEPSQVTCNSPEYDSSAIWIRLAINYTDACYNIHDLYKEKFNSGTNNQSTYLWESDDCDRQWEARMPENYDDAANFSRISWMLMTNPGEWSGFPNHDPTGVALRVFPGEDCQETPEEPFYQWGGCDEPANDCTELPYGVSSFLVMRRGEQDKSGGDCLVAAERGMGERARGVQLGLFFVLTVGGVLLNIWF